MKFRHVSLLLRFLGVALVPLILAACAGERVHREGLALIAQGRYEEGVRNLELASRTVPGNVQFRADYRRYREEQVNHLLVSADSARRKQTWETGEALYRQVLQVDPDNSRAQAGLQSIQQERRDAPVLEQVEATLSKGDLEAASRLLHSLQEPAATERGAALKRRIELLGENNNGREVKLRLAQRKLVSMDFRDANLRTVFEALARSGGVNVIFDQDVRADLRTTIVLRDSYVDNAIDLLLQTNHLEKKVLNANTILVYPNVAEKQKDYQELVIRGFYLENADVKQVQAMVKAILKSRDTFIDEKLNLLVMRDTPEVVRLAEKLIAMNDLAEPEVMLDVEVLEVKRSRLSELGVQLPTSLSLSPLKAAGATTLSDLKQLNSDGIGANLAGASINLRREVGDANILANPRIRARNREKAKIMIGDKLPVSTTTTTATGIVSESVQYLDVGIKLEVEPNVYLQDDVAIKIALEVSSITNQVRTPAGSLTYQIGSRSASTVLRLKDGETQVLAGLIGDEDRMSASRLPGLGDIPILGRLFSNQKDDRQKTEIVLSITPRLIRTIRRAGVGSGEFWSGTEASLRNRPITLQAPQTGGAQGDAIRQAPPTVETMENTSVSSVGSPR